MESGGSKYASQRLVFEELGQGVLDNAFEGDITMMILNANKPILIFIENTGIYDDNGHQLHQY